MTNRYYYLESDRVFDYGPGAPNPDDYDQVAQWIFERRKLAAEIEVGAELSLIERVDDAALHRATYKVAQGGRLLRTGG